MPKTKPEVESVELLIQRFNKGVDSGVIKMTVDHDCGHAYNGWQGQLYDLLSDLAEAMGEEEHEEFQAATDERLSEDDPGLLCVPDFINTLIKEDGGKTPGNQFVTSCECQCPDEQCSTVEGRVEYLQAFMDQQAGMDPDNLEHSKSWFRFDLMEAYIKAHKK
jgi:hypothetical protein